MDVDFCFYMRRLNTSLGPALSIHLVQQWSGISSDGHGCALDHGAWGRSGRHAGGLLLPPLRFFLLQPLFGHLTPIHGGVRARPAENTHTHRTLVFQSVTADVSCTDAARKGILRVQGEPLDCVIHKESWEQHILLVVLKKVKGFKQTGTAYTIH